MKVCRQVKIGFLTRAIASVALRVSCDETSRIIKQQCVYLRDKIKVVIL